MDDSILNSIKKLLGIQPDDDAFDTDIIIHINSVFAALHQIGVTPEVGVIIQDSSTTWGEWLLKPEQMNMVKTYIYIKVRLVFDPPATSAATASLEKVAAEYEWRLGINEFVFNPDWNLSPAPEVYLLESGEDFPEDADPNAIGYNPETGDLWSNSD